MKIVLTGHKGMIGSRIYDRLEIEPEIQDKIVEENGYLRYCYDEPPKIYNFEVQGLDAPVLDQFLEKLKQLKKEMPYPDLIIHCGGMHDLSARSQPLWDMNFIASQVLFEWARDVDAKVIFFSSLSARVRDNSYGLSKYMGEVLLQEMLGQENYCIVRPATVWCFREQHKREPSVVYKLINRQLEFLYRKYKRDFIHVEAVSDAILALVKAWQPGVYHLGTGKQTSLFSMMRKLYIRAGWIRDDYKFYSDKEFVRRFNGEYAGLPMSKFKGDHRLPKILKNEDRYIKKLPPDKPAKIEGWSGAKRIRSYYPKILKKMRAQLN